MAKEDNLTPFKPGQSGNPNGRPKGSKNLSTILLEMLETDVEEDGEKVKWADSIVKKLLKKANSGDVRAIQEVFDRTEGKAKQEIDMKGQMMNINTEVTPDEAARIKEALDKSI